MIPSQLQRPEFRFCLVRQQEKRAFEPGWQQSANYPYDNERLAQHFAGGGNYGVVTNYGGLAILDIDDKETLSRIEPHLPRTFSVTTAKGRHFYYILTGAAKKLILHTNERHVGELQAGPTFYVVGPGSTHPSGTIYRVDDDAPVKTLGYGEIVELLSPYLRAEREPVPAPDPIRRLLADKHNLRITDVISLTRFKSRGAGQYIGPHPIHGSDTGQNLSIDTHKDRWFCFRHNTGGGALQLLAIKEGILRCEDAGSGALRGDKYRDALRAAGIEPEHKTLFERLVMEGAHNG